MSPNAAILCYNAPGKRGPLTASDNNVDQRPDIYVLSDLHLSAGLSRRTGRTSRLETFFYDRPFSNLIDRIIVRASTRTQPTVLVLNGDVFDFLAMIHIPPDEELEALGISVTRRERRYGMTSEPIKSAWKMRQILRGHPVFFAALARFLRAGHRIHVIRGNHDLELYWRAVREAFYEEFVAVVRGEGEEIDEDTVRSGLEFHPWFYYEPGRVWIEHGHQYEASNSLRFLLNPVLAHSGGDREGLDFPTGSLFVLAVYNRFKLIDPYSAQVFSLEQYLDLISTYNVLDLAKSLLLHFPFFVRMLRHVRIFEISGVAGVSEVHRKRRAELAREHGLEERLERIDALRRVPMGKTKYALFRDMMRPIVRGVLLFGALAILSIALWMLLFMLIQETSFLAETVVGKASLMAVLALLTVLGIFVGGSFFSRRYRSRRDPMHEILPERAARLGEILDVPMVVMGHSHGVDFMSAPTPGKPVRYANSGTWTQVRGPWDTLQPQAHQFTFVHVHGDELEVLRWNDAGARWEPVTILEDHEPKGIDRLIQEPPDPV